MFGSKRRFVAAVRVRDAVSEAGNGSGHLAHCCHGSLLLNTVEPNGPTQGPLSARVSPTSRVGRSAHDAGSREARGRSGRVYATHGRSAPPSRLRAVGAVAEDVDDVLRLGEAVLGRDAAAHSRRHPPRSRRSGRTCGRSGGGGGPVRAGAVEALALRRCSESASPSRAEVGERAVHGRQADGGARRAQRGCSACALTKPSVSARASRTPRAARCCASTMPRLPPRSRTPGTRRARCAGRAPQPMQPADHVDRGTRSS